ncbi:MAG: tyrosine-type recombinase/integrase [Rhodanobacteraceae bacterium]
MSVQSIIGATHSAHGPKPLFPRPMLKLSPVFITQISRRILYDPAFGVTNLCHKGAVTVATYRKRGKRWQAMVRRKGFAEVAKSFPTLGAARTWAERTERDQAERTASGITDDDLMTVRACIEWYTHPDRENDPWGRTKTADLHRLLGYEIAGRIAAELKAADYIRHIEQRRKMGAGPATAGNDLIWMRQVLRSVRAGKGVKAINLVELDDATADLRRRKLIQKSRLRDRRLSADEEKTLLEHFAKRGGEIPMVDIALFALATSRRQEEITRLRWRDLDKDKGIAWLDDVKHPRHKVGNRRAFRVLPEAWKLIERQPKVAPEVFPCNPKSIGSAFTNACHFLGIKGLHFHDLRHEATSRLFERGYSIQEVAQFTLHESWATLKRYTHLRPEDVKERSTC